MVVMALAMAGVSDRADAISFTPIQCAPCPTVTNLGSQGGILYETRTSHATGFPRYAAEACTTTPSIGTCYANDINHLRSISANHYVRRIDLWADRFRTETNYDYVELRGAFGVGATRLSGSSPALQWHTFIDPFGYGLQYLPMYMQFITDATVSFTGFLFSDIRVCCGAAGATDPALPVALGARNAGVLLGNNDVVYFKFNTSSATGAPTDYLNITLYADVLTHTHDFDLYARCGAKPTPTQWDFRSNNPRSEEFLTFPQNAAGCPHPGTWWFAVHSYSGKGLFNFVVNAQKKSMRGEIAVGITWDALAGGQFDAVRFGMLNAIRAYYGLTEGQHYISKIHIYNNVPFTFDGGGYPLCTCGSDTCQFCFLNWGAGGAQAWPCNPQGTSISNFAWGWYFSSTTPCSAEGCVFEPAVMHEFGHLAFCQGDENEVPAPGGTGPCGPGGGCMHSAMSEAFYEFCNASNHGKTAATHPTCDPSPLPATWSIPASVVWRPTSEADPHIYRFHQISTDANGNIAGWYGGFIDPVTHP